MLWKEAAHISLPLFNDVKHVRDCTEFSFENEQKGRKELSSFSKFCFDTVMGRFDCSNKAGLRILTLWLQSKLLVSE